MGPAPKSILLGFFEPRVRAWFFLFLFNLEEKQTVGRHKTGSSRGQIADRMVRALAAAGDMILSFAAAFVFFRIKVGEMETREKLKIRCDFER